MTEYIYASQIYQSVGDVETAVTALKNRLENNPTEWCCVKPQINIRQMTLFNGDEITVWDVGDALSDAEIMALTPSDEGLYHIYSTQAGDNLSDLSPIDLLTKVTLLRNSYARRLIADKYFEVTEDAGNLNSEDTENPDAGIDVTNEDMSVFMS